MTERRVVKRVIGIGSGDDWDALRETLAEHGVDIDACGDEVSSDDPVRVNPQLGSMRRHPAHGGLAILHAFLRAGAKAVDGPILNGDGHHAA